MGMRYEQQAMLLVGQKNRYRSIFVRRQHYACQRGVTPLESPKPNDKMQRNLEKQTRYRINSLKSKCV